MLSTYRQPAVAGSFYPAAPGRLKALLNSFTPRAANLPDIPKALIVPHAGYIYSGPTAAAGYQAAAGVKYDQIILIGPSHHYLFKGLAQDDHTFWQTPLGKLKVKHLKDTPPYLFTAASYHAPEHSLEVQLPFIQTYLTPNIPISPLLISSPDYLDKLTRIIEEQITSKTLIIISSDLSHYYPDDLARQLDKQTITTILNLNTQALLSNQHVQACGQYAIALLLNLAKSKHWQGYLIDYSTSADTAGSPDQVVGYTSIAFT